MSRYHLPCGGTASASVCADSATAGSRTSTARSKLRPQIPFGPTDRPAEDAAVGLKEAALRGRDASCRRKRLRWRSIQIWPKDVGIQYRGIRLRLITYVTQPLPTVLSVKSPRWLTPGCILHTYFL